MNDKLKEIETENYIWLIYIIIIFLSWYSNDLEREYFINNNELCKDEYRKIIISIFSLLVIIYSYFFKSSIDSIHSLSPSDSIKKQKLTKLSSVAAALILISGIIYLYIAYYDENIDVEIAFN